MGRITATEAARGFSVLLSRVAAGEEVEITRSGATVAVVTPPRTRFQSAERFRALLASAPPLDDRFASDVRAARSELEAVQGEEHWPAS